MQRVRKAPVGEDKYQLLFMCPGCGYEHAIDGRWSFNHNYEKPSFHPSILNSIMNDDGVTKMTVCHAFIVHGQILFLNDCAHALRGQTVDLPEYIDIDKYIVVSNNSQIHTP